MQLKNGLTSQSLDPDTLGVAAAEVVDLDGHPLYHLTLMGPNVTDFWQTVKAAQPGKPYQIYGTGAQDKRDFYSSIFNETWFAPLNKTLSAAGSFKRFVSPSSSVLYLEDQSGRTWDIDSATVVSTDTLNRKRTAFETMLAQRSREGVLDGLAAAWKKYGSAANPPGVKTQSLGASSFPSLDSLTLPDGNIDVKTLVKTMRDREGKITTLATNANYPGELGSCEGLFCAGLRFSAAVRKYPTQPYNEVSPESNTYLISVPQMLGALLL